MDTPTRKRSAALERGAALLANRRTDARTTGSSLMFGSEDPPARATRFATNTSVPTRDTYSSQTPAQRAAQLLARRRRNYVVDTSGPEGWPAVNPNHSGTGSVDLDTRGSFSRVAELPRGAEPSDAELSTDSPARRLPFERPGLFTLKGTNRPTSKPCRTAAGVRRDFSPRGGASSPRVASSRAAWDRQTLRQQAEAVRQLVGQLQQPAPATRRRCQPTLRQPPLQMWSGIVLERPEGMKSWSRRVAELRGAELQARATNRSLKIGWHPFRCHIEFVAVVVVVVCLFSAFKLL
eukprot:SAG11_NODE_1319_length_5209_cov_10.314873_8_plen_293_part_00